MTESEFNKNKKEMLEKSFVVVEQVLINGMKLRSFIKDDEVVKEALVKAENDSFGSAVFLGCSRGLGLQALA